MLGLYPTEIVSYLGGLPTPYVLGLMTVFCFSAVLFMLRFFGAVGLYVFIVVGVIAANIQVLKVVSFPFYGHPVALGTEIFALTYLCTDILTEFYGKEKARRGIWLGFSGYILMTVIMVLGMGYAPAPASAVGPDMSWAVANHGHMTSLFMPAPAIFAASMIAYLCSQYYDIWMFSWLKRLTGQRALWLRNNVSTILSAIIDSIIFNVFAWIIFSDNPVDTHTLIFTYILGTFGLRVVISLLDTPFLYLAKYFVPKGR